VAIVDTVMAPAKIEKRGASIDSPMRWRHRKARADGSSASFPLKPPFA
jgi:hypothetical protein